MECTFESPKGILLTSSYYTLEWGRKAIWCDCQQLHFIRRPLLYVHLLKDGITFLSYIIVFFQMFTSLRKYFCHVTIILPCSLFLINEYNITQIHNKVYSDWYKIAPHISLSPNISTWHSSKHFKHFSKLHFLLNEIY